MKKKPSRIDLSPLDREALERAIALKRARSREDRREVEGQLKVNPWLTVAMDACYDAQMLLVRPKLWCPIPMDLDRNEIEATIAKGDDGKNGGYAAAKLLRRMLRAGLSQYEPEPLRRLAEAKRRAPEAAVALP